MLTEVYLSPDELARRWRTLTADPDIPEHFEINEFGEVIVSPAPSNKHELVAFTVAKALEQQLGPSASTALSVATDRGVKRPDACWMPPARWAESRYADPLPFVPDICVEVLSPSNTRAENQMKVGAYIRGGAREVVVIGLEGEVEYFGPGGQLTASGFGLQLRIPAELL